MPELKTYNLFISHSWGYTNAYDKLCNLLDENSFFKYSNHSIPKDDPVHTNGTYTDLYNAIQRKISPCHAVLILAGVYSSYSNWISKEIQIAKTDFSNRKPIIAIEPWGSEKTSQVVKTNAVEVVKWNSSSIVDAIRRHAI